MLRTLAQLIEVSNMKILFPFFIFFVVILLYLWLYILLTSTHVSFKSIAHVPCGISIVILVNHITRSKRWCCMSTFQEKDCHDSNGHKTNPFKIKFTHLETNNLAFHHWYLPTLHPTNPPSPLPPNINFSWENLPMETERAMLFFL